jgi:hypothetical protein
MTLDATLEIRRRLAKDDVSSWSKNWVGWVGWLGGNVRYPTHFGWVGRAYY